ncbi:hypothetical protein SLS58_006522 [Diplodia intermedia]|uniref:Uncharacterized protein n=1 Tax=Diplodia intermedia TaxID=856260 RepID=A0ABR3TMV1_9PEZI
MESPRLKPTGGNKVAVFIRSTDDVFLKSRNEIKPQEDGVRKVIKLSRLPWNGDRSVSIPTQRENHDDGRENCPCCRFDATVNVDKIGNAFWLKRLAGTVTEMYIFDAPLRQDSGGGGGGNGGGDGTFQLLRDDDGSEAAAAAPTATWPMA